MKKKRKPRVSNFSPTERIVAHVDITILQKLLLYTELRNLHGLSNGRIVGVALRELFNLIDLDSLISKAA